MKQHACGICGEPVYEDSGTIVWAKVDGRSTPVHRSHVEEPDGADIELEDDDDSDDNLPQETDDA
jgi:hypothetical protein